MKRERMEIFSDGVLGIVLTLLVIELKPPKSHNVAGFVEAAPGLLIHALVFFSVGMCWLAHHQSLSRTISVNTATLGWNLLFLFWITLLPLCGKVAAAAPLAPLGPSSIALVLGCAIFAGLKTIYSARSSLRDDPVMMPVARRRRNIFLVAMIFCFICAGLAWIWPPLGYFAVPPLGLNLILPSAEQVEARSEKRRQLEQHSERVG